MREDEADDEDPVANPAMKRNIVVININDPRVYPVVNRRKPRSGR